MIRLVCLVAATLPFWTAAVAEPLPVARHVEVHTGPKPRVGAERRVGIVTPGIPRDPGPRLLPVRLSTDYLPPRRVVTVVRGPGTSATAGRDSAAQTGRSFDPDVLRVLLDVCEPTAPPDALLRDAGYPTRGD